MKFMGKQKKIINKIKYDSGQTTPLGTKPNDECYISMQDIINELSLWKDKFRNKNIICPCDWDIFDEEEGLNVYSIKIDFENDGIVGHTNVIQSVSYTLFDLEDNNKMQVVKVGEKEIDSFLRDRVKCNFVRTFVENANEWGIKSITASGYNPANDRGIKFQDVNFRDYDICVTNPPFSLYKEFLTKLIDSKIDFIILAPYLNRVNPSIGVPLMKRECFLGYGRHLNLSFYNPTAKNKYKTMTVGVDWLTSYDDAQKHYDKRKMKNGFKYEAYKNDYRKMENMTMKDGTNPIRINKYTAIPDDYMGWMFCSIGVLDVLSYDEFEWYLTNAAGYYNTENPEHNPFNHRTFDEMVMAQSYIDFSGMNQKERRAACKATGETGFHGLVIRRKKHEKNSK
jgi:hypothetical protein